MHVLRRAFGDLAPLPAPPSLPCPAGWDAAACAARNSPAVLAEQQALVDKLNSITGVSLFLSDVPGFVGTLFDGVVAGAVAGAKSRETEITQKVQDTAKPYIVKTVLVGALATVASVGLTVLAVRKCRRRCGAGR